MPWLFIIETFLLFYRPPACSLRCRDGLESDLPADSVFDKLTTEAHAVYLLPYSYPQVRANTCRTRTIPCHTLASMQGEQCT